MKRLACLLCFCLSILRMWGQSLEGYVCDIITRKPVADAVVFLDGTLFRTVTDAEGRFSIQTDKVLNVPLVIRHLSYELYIVENPFEKDLSAILLSEKNSVIEEVVISFQYSRERLMAAFYEQFFGLSLSGKSCKIQNEEEIEIFYDFEQNKLKASCGQPLEIVNEYLGYAIQYDLVAFEVEYAKRTLQNEWVKKSSILGVSSFTDLAPERSKIRKRRERIYLQSPECFFKGLITKRLKAIDYEVFQKGMLVNVYDYLEVSDTLALKTVRIKPNSGIQTSIVGLTKAKGILTVRYKKRFQSDVIFLSDLLWVDECGIVTPPLDIYYSGELGKQRMGGLLPREYGLHH